MSKLNFKNKNITPNRLLAIIVLVLVILVPRLIDNQYLWSILVVANIYAAIGIGFDLLLGYTGLSVLGFGLFVGIGGYTTAFLNLHYGMPPWLTMPLSGLVGAMFGIILGLPSLRLKGFYLALVSFTAAAIAEKLVIVFNSVTYGREGLSGIDPISSSNAGSYYVSIALLLVSVCVLLVIVKSKIGLILRSICDDETAAIAVGINTNRYKLMAFLVGSFFGGFWGSFWAHFMMHIGPEIFGLQMAITIFMVTIVGGIGTIVGAVGGAYLLIIMNELLREIGEFRLLIYCILTIIIYLLLPKGIVPPAIKYAAAGLSKVSNIFKFER